MNKDLLKENRVHGDPTFPLGIYTLTLGSGQCLFDCHWHDEPEFLLVAEGKAVVQIESGSIEVSAGQALFINSGEIHTAFSTNASGCTFHALVFSSLLLSGSMPDTLKSRYIDPVMENRTIVQKYFTRDDSTGREILQELKEIIKANELKAFAYELMIKSKLYKIFSILLSRSVPGLKKDLNPSNKSEKLKRVLQYIHTNYSLKISIKDLAGLVNMSEGHFCRFFRQQVKQTPINYLNYYRVLKAAKFLEDNDKKILEIAYETGFENISYFIVIFKRCMKCTPSEYRRRIIQNL